MTNKETVLVITPEQTNIINTLDRTLYRRAEVKDRLEDLEKGTTKQKRVSFSNGDGTSSIFQADHGLVRAADIFIVETYRKLVFEQVPDPTQPNGFRTEKNNDMAEVANNIIKRYS